VGFIGGRPGGAGGRLVQSWAPAMGHPQPTASTFLSWVAPQSPCISLHEKQEGTPVEKQSRRHEAHC